MEKDKKCSVINLRTYLEKGEEERIEALIDDFKCPYNKEVENFLKMSAINFAKKKQAITYLLISSESAELVGYFSLTLKPLTIDIDKVSRRMARKLERICALDEENNTYTVAAYLIGQIGKNYGISKEQQISGDDLLTFAEEKIIEAQGIVGGVVEFLECEDTKFLVDFYESHNFKLVNKRGNYLQYLKLL